MVCPLGRLVRPLQVVCPLVFPPQPHNQLGDQVSRTVSEHGVGGAGVKGKVFFIQANVSPSYSANLAIDVIPTCTPKGNLLIFCPEHCRFSWVSPREYMWFQSMDYSDFFSSTQIEQLGSQFSYLQLIQLSGNSFQQRSAGAFVVAILLLDRLRLLGDAV